MPTISTFGLHSLADWGEPGFLIRPENRAKVRRSIRFRLGRHAHQGPSAWYLIRLHFRITFPRALKPGIVLVGASTNGRAAAQIRFESSRRGRRARIRWQTLDYIRGRREHETASRVVDVEYTNYLQYKGVKPGRNTFSVRYEQIGSLVPDEIQVLPDSGIILTRKAPAHVKLKVVEPPSRVTEGSRFAITYELENTGDRAAQGVVVSAFNHKGAEALIGRRRVGVLREAARGTLHFRAISIGRLSVELSVRSSANRPGAIVPLIVERRPSFRRELQGMLPQILGVLLIGFGVAYLWRKRLLA